MIRGFVTIALGGALLVMGAAPAHAASAAPLPSAERPSADQSTESPRAEREGGETREAAASSEARRSLAPPHPFREQVLPQGRV